MLKMNCSCASSSKSQVDDSNKWSEPHEARKKKDYFNAMFYDYQKQILDACCNTNCQLEDLEEWTFERLKIMIMLEQPREQKRYSKDWIYRVEQEVGQDPKLKRHLDFIRGKTDSDYLRMLDCTSHYATLKAHNDWKSPMKSEWLFNQECRLFAFKCQYINSADTEAFISHCKNIVNIKFEEVVGREKYEILGKKKFQDFNFSSILGADMLKIEFNQLPIHEFNTNFQLCLHKGFIYFLKKDLWILYLELFKKKLHRNLKEMRYKNICDPRFVDVVNMIKEVQKIRFENLDEGCLKIQDIEELDELCNKNYFPPCMTILYKELQSKNFLGHFGRTQLGTFLHGGGVSCDHQLELWNKQFLKKMPFEKYKLKRYDYNIKYLYGLTGQRGPINRQSCREVFNTSLDKNNYTGCPFLNNAELELVELCDSNCFTNEQKEKILEKIEDTEDAQIRCTDFLKIVNNIPFEKNVDVINSPIDFLQWRCKLESQVDNSDLSDEDFFVG